MSSVQVPEQTDAIPYLHMQNEQVSNSKLKELYLHNH